MAKMTGKSEGASPAAPRTNSAKGSQGQTVRLPVGPTGPRGRLCELLKIPASTDNPQVFEDAVRMIEGLNQELAKAGGAKKGS